jgi:hypothetical protein
VQLPAFSCSRSRALGSGAASSYGGQPTTANIEAYHEGVGLVGSQYRFNTFLELVAHYR